MYASLVWCNDDLFLAFSRDLAITFFWMLMHMYTYIIAISWPHTIYRDMLITLHRYEWCGQGERRTQNSFMPIQEHSWRTLSPARSLPTSPVLPLSQIKMLSQQFIPSSMKLMKWLVRFSPHSVHVCIMHTCMYTHMHVHIHAHTCIHISKTQFIRAKLDSL